MSVMHLNDLSSTLTLGSDVLSAACASDVTACRTIRVDTIGSESLVMALLPELVWCEWCMASMSQVRRPDRGDQVRLRTIGTIPGPSDSSRRQLLQQRLRLLQIARVEPLRKPPVNPSKQFACRGLHCERQRRARLMAARSS